jgi:hypothetical protein
VLLGLSSCAKSPEAEDYLHPPVPYPFSDWRIAEGVFVDGKLWLRSGDNRISEGLVSLDLSTNTQTTQFERDVIDIERSGEHLWVLRTDSENRKVVTISVFEGGVFREFAGFALAMNDRPIALLVHDDQPVVLLAHSVRIWSKVRKVWDVKELRAELFEDALDRVTVGMPTDMKYLYVGHNAGEFGGGLHRVDLTTGLAIRIERDDPGRKYPLEGPLVAPRVTSIITDPAKPSCVIVSVGLVHFISSGRIVRVCDDDVAVTFENIVEEEVFEQGRKEKLSEAIFSLTSGAGGRYWAVGILGLYEFIPGHDVPITHKIPELISVGRIRLSREVPGVIILRTDINAAVSLSGFTPLVVSAE